MSGARGGARRKRLLLVILAAALAAACIASVAAGAVRVSPLTVLRVFLHGAGIAAGPAPTGQHTAIVLHIRLPRVLAAVIVGATLAVCGAVMQGVFRNPLASPDVLGISAGASLGAVLAISTGLFAAGALFLPLLAVAGALSSALLIYAISSRGGRASLLFVVLAGLAVSSLLNGLVSAVLLFSNTYEVSQFIFWTMGGLEGRMWKHITLALPFLAVSLTVLFLYMRELNIFGLGEESAASLGMHVERTKRILLAATAVATAMAVSVAGPVGFVGLLVPHLFRILLGPDHRTLLPAAALGGALFLVLCDLLGRLLIPPFEIRVGIVTALLGSPYFLFLVIRSQRRGLRQP
jgi:iron complex transport system permease protein